MRFHTTGSAKVRSVATCLLFDPKDGKIQHVHRVVTVDGAPETSKAELESQTLKLAKEVGLETGHLQILHVEDAAISEPAHYAVDPNSRTLVKRKVFGAASHRPDRRQQP